MRPNVLIYATDVNRSRAWYEGLGFRLRRVNRNGGWAELEWAAGTENFLHGTGSPRPAGFALPGFEPQEPLERVTARLMAAGVLDDSLILDEGFGRVLRLRDRDGYELDIVEHDAELYARKNPHRNRHPDPRRERLTRLLRRPAGPACGERRPRDGHAGRGCAPAVAPC